MNALILSALSGVIMMFSGIVLKDNKSGARLLAMILLAIIIVANLLQLRGVEFFSVDTKGMLLFDRFATLFTLVIFICTFFFFLLSAKEMEKVGKDYSEFFALIFFINKLKKNMVKGEHNRCLIHLQIHPKVCRVS